jgi:aerobic C4-dicarboxylate transport protein
MIAPIIFCTVVVGIAGMEDMKKVGKTGGYALLYFEIVSTIVLIVGLTIVNVVQPGAGMNIDPATLDTKGIAAYAKPGQLQSTTEFLRNVIPRTVVDAFAKGEILQVLLLFAVLFGFALHRFGGRGTLVFDWIEKASHVLFSIVGVIMKVAPIGAFGAMAFTIGKYGVGSLLSLGKLMGTFYLTCLVFILVVLGIIARTHGFSILKFIRYIKEELLIVLGTSSSESVLPRMMAKMENLGVKKSTVGLVIPTGYSFNLDGTSIYLTMAAVFIAQATNTQMTITQQLTLLLVLFADVEGRGGCDGQWIYRAGGDAVRRRPRSGRRPRVDSRHRPLHVRSARAYEPDRQWGRDGRRRQMVWRARHQTDAQGARQRNRRRGRRTGRGLGRGGAAHAGESCVSRVVGTQCAIAA